MDLALHILFKQSSLRGALVSLLLGLPSPFRETTLCFAMSPSQQQTDAMLPIATVFDGVASQYLEAVAVQFEQWEFWTYAQLQEASVQIAKALGGRIAHGQQVAVLPATVPSPDRGNSRHSSTGVVYVPIDADLPRGRIKQLLANLTDPIALCLQGQDALLPPNVDRAWLVPNSPEKAIQALCRRIESRRPVALKGGSPIVSGRCSSKLACQTC